MSHLEIGGDKRIYQHLSASLGASYMIKHFSFESGMKLITGFINIYARSEDPISFSPRLPIA